MLSDVTHDVDNGVSRCDDSTMTKRTPTATPTPYPAGGRLAAALAQAQELAAAASRREPSTRVLAVRVPAELHARLMAAATARGLPLAELLRVLLVDAAERLDGLA